MQAMLHPSWRFQLQDYLASPAFEDLVHKVQRAYQAETVYPPAEAVFQGLNQTPFGQVKVCILGQDPYHGPGQANGMAFSVARGVPLPPSLKNIYKELEADLGCPPAAHGDLIHWAQQGVLLLNTVLTVQEGQAHSHRDFGWQVLTDQVIQVLNQQATPIVFILWGRPAQEKAALIDGSFHRILQASHPSPLSAYRSFFGSRPFSTSNQQLTQWGLQPIQWCLPQ